MIEDIVLELPEADEASGILFQPQYLDSGVGMETFHPMLTTSFEDYTVTEGLLLLLLLFLVTAACVRVLRSGFSWLR